MIGHAEHLGQGVEGIGGRVIDRVREPEDIGRSLDLDDVARRRHAGQITAGEMPRVALVGLRVDRCIDRMVVPAEVDVTLDLDRLVDIEGGEGADRDRLLCYLSLYDPFPVGRAARHGHDLDGESGHEVLGGHGELIVEDDLVLIPQAVAVAIDPLVLDHEHTLGTVRRAVLEVGLIRVLYRPGRVYRAATRRHRSGIVEIDERGPVGIVGLAVADRNVPRPAADRGIGRIGERKPVDRLGEPRLGDEEGLRGLPLVARDLQIHRRYHRHRGADDGYREEDEKRDYQHVSALSIRLLHQLFRHVVSVLPY